jgi:hypothetical protein
VFICFRIGERREPEVVDDEQVGLGDLLQRPISRERAISRCVSPWRSRTRTCR